MSAENHNRIQRFQPDKIYAYTGIFEIDYFDREQNVEGVSKVGFGSKWMWKKFPNLGKNPANP